MSHNPPPAFEPDPASPDPASRRLAGTAAKASLYPLVILFLIQAVDQMNRFLPAALFPALKRQFSLSDFQLGSLSSAFVFLAAVAPVPCRLLLDPSSPPPTPPLAHL